MDVFGHHWHNHPQRIATAWQARVQPDDYVLMAGDISWGMKLTDALADLTWIDTLPGHKVMIKGNHDYWWDRLGPLRPYLPPGITALQANATDIGQAVICGTRGWMTPETPGFKPNSDMRIYQRELARLERALDEARKLAAGTRPIIVLIHYPPFVDGQPTQFATMVAAAQATTCLYGHLHRPEDWHSAVQGEVDGVYYQLTACDYLNFGPVAVRGLSRYQNLY